MNSLVVLCTEVTGNQTGGEQDVLCSLTIARLSAAPLEPNWRDMGKALQIQDMWKLINWMVTSKTKQGMFGPEKRRLWRDLIPVCKNLMET